MSERREREERQRAKLDDDIALFRYGLIADLVHLPRGAGSGLYAKLRQKAEGIYVIPGSRRCRVAAETLREWLSLYREGGFEALRPMRRSDSGKARKLPVEVIDTLVLLKETHDLTVSEVIALAYEQKLVPLDLPLPPSTVHRHLEAAGAMEKPPSEGSSKDHRRFTYEMAGELWMSDVMHGPAVVVDGHRKRKTYLIAFIDDATRVVPYAAFALSENTAAFLPALREAVMRRGIPKRLYVDNGSVFRSRHLALVCARAGITLIHARPYQPAGKGKQERWFRTARQQLLRTLADSDLRSLDALNRRLWAWVEGEYHQTPHRGLDGQTPFDAWALRSSQVHLPGPELDLEELFSFEEKRRVQRDRTVSLHGHIYEVDACLVGETAVLRYDPARLGGPIRVFHRGKLLQTATVVDVFANCSVKRDHSSKNLTPSRNPNEPADGLAFASPIEPLHGIPNETVSAGSTEPPDTLTFSSLAERASGKAEEE